MVQRSRVTDRSQSVVLKILSSMSTVPASKFRRVCVCVCVYSKARGLIGKVVEDAGGSLTNVTMATGLVSRTSIYQNISYLYIYHSLSPSLPQEWNGWDDGNG